MALWHTRTADEVLKDLESVHEGLSQAEATRRLDHYGPNDIKETKKRTPFGMLLDQFKDFMIIVLIAAAVISGFIGELTDTIAIIVIVVLNAIIGFVQEYRAQKAIEALREMAAPSATVRRDGKVTDVPSSELVPGDIVLLEAGKIVPADMRITEEARLKVEEAALTGESVPVDKQAGELHDENLPLGDRSNMGYKGTIVSYGRGTGVVTATGMGTELGRIATMLQEEEEVKTPLQKRLAVFGKKLAIAVLVICAVVFGFGLLRGEPVLLMLLTAISLAVAAIPEALPAVVTISLALGAKKMVRQSALIRKLPAVETLGSVTYICSDKTGTLTLNRMTVEEMYLGGELIKTAELHERRSSGSDSRSALFNSHVFSDFLKALALSNDARVGSNGSIMGDPTEAALYKIAQENGFDKVELAKEMPRVRELPFDSDRKCMTTFHEWQGGYISFTKGAVDVLLDKSVKVATEKGINDLSIPEVLQVNDRMAADGLRVLGIAMRKWDSLPDDMTPENVEHDLIILGLAGLLDPPREEAIEAIRLCKEAGIKPVMITGDHPVTARTIARRLGILDGDSEDVITGLELDRLSMEEFEERVEHISVYARVAPEQKLKIVKALQDKGQFAAMTGDGVNDAPALKRADIGIAMGITGTDVSKEAAHMILLDDNFATIVKAVREGRRIFDNIRKFIRYTMTSNSGEIWTIFLAPFFGLPIPLLPIHILWINLVTDGLPGLALTAEPGEKGLMKRPPRHPQESIFAHGMAKQIIWVGLLMGGVSIFSQAWSIRVGSENWQTIVFTVLCLSQMGNVMAIRSERESLFGMGLFTNRPLLFAVALTFLLQMATIYVPFLNPIFKTSPLSLGELVFALAISTIVFFAVEADKLLLRRRLAY